jgi:competence protein ComEA
VERAALLVAAGLLLVALPGAIPTPTPGRLAIDLNCDPPARLEALPGIGAERARALAAARPFAAVDDLARLPGIGPRTLARLRPLAVLGDCR